eukprot:CAMPEP_0118639026 /NCGR_PEP_ID=MMETSP0785-20121206/4007_1 /TAXON_ID=91992 /ORGANISM="Bolidomonas pacifica, Strain CCMP 1866" /LENGTH=105 /DNA_ID=CAMNT_0006530333 /DNA_START=35 /DNA_END=353 /DNA_ORIENTATION=-
MALLMALSFCASLISLLEATAVAAAFAALRAALALLLLRALASATFLIGFSLSAMNLDFIFSTMPPARGAVACSASSRRPGTNPEVLRGRSTRTCCNSRQPGPSG